MGGALVAAFGPAVVDVIADKVTGYIDSLGEKPAPGGYLRQPLRLAAPMGTMAPGGLEPTRAYGVALQGNVPGGLWAGRRAGVSLGGAPRPF
jgi:hypothetical protein